jgi:hypothetical protein
MAKSTRKPTTIYLDPRVARAVKIKAAVTGESISDQVNDALTASLTRDEEDLRIIRARRKRPTRPFEDVLKDMKRDGLL